MKKSIFLLSLIFFGFPCIGEENGVPRITHGVTVGDVESRTAVVWSRADQEATMKVIVRSPDGKEIFDATCVRADDDYTGQVLLENLKSNTQYEYKVWFESSNGNKSGTAGGRFKTAPERHQKQAVKIAWSGDFAGQNVCRDRELGFPIFNAIHQEAADLFIGLGDMIYADNTCEEIGKYGNRQVPGNFIQSADLADFWAHWRYAREDAAFQKLLSSTPYYGIWDDHEVVNDFGPLHDTRDSTPYSADVPLLPIGLKAFLDYTPIRKSPHTPNRLYRNIRWGKHLELFFLDNRQYRDANLAADHPERKKTMLGREQIEWLREKIHSSNATWKVLVSSVPISIPTGQPQNLGRDGWGNDDETTDPTIEGIPQSDTGFEQELIEIVEFLRDEKANALFITTDVHFAEVFKYTPFKDNNYSFHEIVVGPGNAGLFPNRAFDKTLGTESLFFFGPENEDTVTTWEDALKWFNYATIEIDYSGELVVNVKDTWGESVYSLHLSR